MEESDEPDQPISVGRQEIRKRRRPSQPMVDKSQQTEVTEKKKHMVTPQSSGPKVTFSIGNIPGSKGTYSAKEYESLRVSSQLQQTWTKRKHGQEMTDKSLQVDTAAEERKEVKLDDETVALEEKPAGVGEAAPELPESVQEVEISPSRHSIQLKIDRSQQTSCTGDWTMMKIPQIEKVDKEQQTYFSESEIVVMSRSGSSLTKSKEGAQKCKSSGKIFVSGHPEFQPATSSHEEIRQKNSSRILFTPENKADTPWLSEDGSRQELTIPVVVTKMAPTEGQSLLAEETSTEIEPGPAEKTPIQVQPSVEETPASETATTTAEAYVDAWPPAVEKSSSVELPVEIQPSLVEEALSEELSHQVESSAAEVPPSEELPAEIHLPLSGKPPVEVQPLAAKEALEEATATVELVTVEETPAKVQPPSDEESPTAKDPDLGLPTTVEAPSEKAAAKVQSMTAENAHIEEASIEAQPLPAEEAPAEVWFPSFDEAPLEEAPAEAQPPPDKEVYAKVWLPSLKDAPIEVAPAEAQPPPAEEAPAEEAPVEVWFPSFEEASIEETPAEAQPPSAEEGPEEGAFVKVWSPSFEEDPIEEAPAETQPPPAEKAPVEEDPAEAELPPAEETPAEEAPAEVWSPSFEDKPIEEIPVEAQALATEKRFADGVLSEFQPPPGEKAPEEVLAEAQPLPTEEAFTEVQSPPAAEEHAEGTPVDKHLSLIVVPIKEFPVQEMSAEVPPLSSEQPPEDAENVSPKLPSPQVAGISEEKLVEVALKGDKKFEEAPPVPEDESNAKDEQVSTIEIEGVIRIQLKDPS